MLGYKTWRYLVSGFERVIPVQILVEDSFSVPSGRHSLCMYLVADVLSEHLQN